MVVKILVLEDYVRIKTYLTNNVVLKKINKGKSFECDLNLFQSVLIYKIINL